MNPDLASLRDRVRSAKGADRELDLAIHMEICPQEYAGRWTWDENLRPPPLTASIDAALALVERVLPGWHYGLTRGFYFGLEKPKDYPDDIGWDFYTEELRPTAPLAILDALLSALSDSTFLPPLIKDED